MLQNIAVQVSLVGVALITAAYLFVYLRSGSSEDFTAVKRRMYRIRAVWFVVLAGVLGIAAAVTLPAMPYGPTHGGADGPAVTVNARGYQWYWELDREEVPVGEEVAFRVTAGDVNHGFGIYDEDDRMIAQTQAMPGHVNVLRHTFSEAGTYTVLCLEYCGIAHHVMAARFDAVNNQ